MITDASKKMFACSRWDQALYLMIASIAGIVLGIARRLTPSPGGLGTHRQLGLPPCLFLRLTGVPCPCCGLTTSFAHAARLHFIEALIAQPFGLVVFLVTVSIIPLSVCLICKRVALRRLIESATVSPTMYLLITLCAIGWVYKLVVMM